MATNAEAKGPDLAAGIPATDLAEGKMLSGRVGDDAVLVARVNGQCFAIGATCSHYGGPLAEGLLEGTMVRCPWHHAGFDVRTGAAERTPALDALPCWRVDESGGRIKVIGRADDAARAAHTGIAETSAARSGIAETATARASNVAPPESIVIIGAGAAGIAAAVTLRSEGFAGPVTIVDSDADAPVDRPNLSKDFLAGTAEEAWVHLRTPEFFSEQRITVERARVTELKLAEHRLVLDDGRSLSFGKLLLATGASPIVLPLPSTGRIPMMTLRSLADSRAIIAAAERAGKAGRVVVIGASFIGLEVAASLRARGLEVHVVAPEARPLERVLGPQVGDWIRALHESHGVVFHLGDKPKELTEDAVILESGTRLPADFVVAGVGVRPNLGLAERAGLTLDRGVMVSETLETSAPDVYAAGDIARWPDPHSGEHIRVEHWVVAERQAQTAARNMLGASEAFVDVPFFWSAHYDTTISYVGHAEKWDAIDIDGSLERRDCAIRYRAGGRTLAVATIGRDLESLKAELGMEQAMSGRPA